MVYLYSNINSTDNHSPVLWYCGML